MPRHLTGLLAFCLTFGVLAGACQAGMPGVTLSDVARMRLEVISFFLLGFVASSAVTWWIWNTLAKDLSFLPRLSFGKSCALVALWGLLFVVVLTMISGARELMTPGAWEKDGVTYRLREKPASDAPRDREQAARRLAGRKEKLQRLGESLRQHAVQHDGSYPAAVTDLATAGVADWNVPHTRGEQYGYVSGRSLGDRQRVLAYEPDCFDDEPLVLFADTTVRAVPRDDLRSLLQERQP